MLLLGCSSKRRAGHILHTIFISISYLGGSLVEGGWIGVIWLKFLFLFQNLFLYFVFVAQFCSFISVRY